MTAGRSGDALSAVRRWAVDWLACADPVAAERCLAADFELRIGAFTLSPRTAYVDGVVTELTRYPGLGITVHDVVTDGRRTALRLSEHGPSTRHGGSAATWRGVAVFDHDDKAITRGWAEEDYWARRRQLAARSSDPVDRPAVAPWSTLPVEPVPGTGDAVARWLQSGAPRLPGVVRDDEDLVEPYEMPATAHGGAVDVMVVSGRRTGFHATLQATGPDGATVVLRVAGMIDVGDDGALSGHLVTDRLGLPRPGANP